MEMKKTLFVSLLVVVMALLVSARWRSAADQAPPANTVAPADTTLAVALSLEEMVNQSDVIAIGTCM